MPITYHYCRFIFTAGPKPIFTAGLGAGGEISAVKIPIFTAGFHAGSDNTFSPGQR